jgi:hypothetical protein
MIFSAFFIPADILSAARSMRLKKENINERKSPKMLVLIRENRKKD